MRPTIISQIHFKQDKIHVRKSDSKIIEHHQTWSLKGANNHQKSIENTIKGMVEQIEAPTTLAQRAPAPKKHLQIQS